MPRVAALDSPSGAPHSHYACGVVATQSHPLGCGRAVVMAVTPYSRSLLCGRAIISVAPPRSRGESSSSSGPRTAHGNVLEPAVALGWSCSDPPLDFAHQVSHPRYVRGQTDSGLVTYRVTGELIARVLLLVTDCFGCCPHSLRAFHTRGPRIVFVVVRLTDAVDSCCPLPKRILHSDSLPGWSPFVLFLLGAHSSLLPLVLHHGDHHDLVTRLGA